MLLKEDTKTKVQLCIGRIIGEVKGQEIIRGFKIKLGNRYIVKRPAQMICNLEIVSLKESDKDNEQNESDDKREIIEAKLRPLRNARSTENKTIRDIIENKHVK